VTTSQERTDAAPDSAPEPPRLLLERTVLDQQMRAGRQEDPRPWGVLPWLGPLLVLVAVIVAGNLVAAYALPSHGTGRTVAGVCLDIGGELILLAALLAFGRSIAARNGGWRAAFGLDGVRRSDWLPWITGIGFVYLGRTVVGVVANLLTDGRATAQASNVALRHPGALTIAVLALTAVVLAPIAEEFMFRGLLLRTFMRRMGFWPAALLSTALFGLFHVYEVHSVVGAITLACEVGVLGLGNSYLVRITGRLTPGIMVHASFNAIALVVAVATARG
jgi:membrane protease YdiL (CAAX protease family)